MIWNLSSRIVFFWHDFPTMKRISSEIREGKVPWVNRSNDTWDQEKKIKKIAKSVSKLVIKSLFCSSRKYQEILKYLNRYCLFYRMRLFLLLLSASWIFTGTFLAMISLTGEVSITVVRRVSRSSLFASAWRWTITLMRFVTRINSFHSKETTDIQFPSIVNFIDWIVIPAELRHMWHYRKTCSRAASTSSTAFGAVFDPTSTTLIRFNGESPYIGRWTGPPLQVVIALNV